MAHKSRQNAILTTICYTLSLLFIYAASAKAMDYTIFVSDIAKSPMLTAVPNTVVAPVLLGLEFLTAFLLLFKPVQRIGLYLSAFLMFMFTLYLSTLYFFYTNIPCSCGGILGKIPYPVHILFNLFFTLLSILGVLLSRKTQEPVRVAVSK